MYFLRFLFILYIMDKAWPNIQHKVFNRKNATFFREEAKTDVPHVH